MSAPLTRPCPSCHGFGDYDHGTPDGRVYRCHECDGEGERPVLCQGWHPHDAEPATEFFDGTPFCARCAEGERAGAFCPQEDAA